MKTLLAFLLTGILVFHLQGQSHSWTAESIDKVSGKDSSGYRGEASSLNSDATWLGTSNSAWLNPSNWENGKLPTPCSHITIMAGNNGPNLNEVISAKSIVLENNVILSLGATGALNISSLDELGEDNDCDGVINSSDSCPNTPEGTMVDNTGCPQLASVQDRLDAGETPLQIINSGVAITELIAKEYGGGLIFYVRPDGTGLISSFRMPDFADRDGYNYWGCSSVSHPRDADAPIGGNATTAIGHGQQNTNYITDNGCGVESSGGLIIYNAAEFCDRLVVTDDGGIIYDDWFFPSRDELREMYFTIGQGASGANNNIGNFDNIRYICSNSFSGSSRDCWAVEFQSGGGLYLSSKVTLNGVRAIRAF